MEIKSPAIEVSKYVLLRDARRARVYFFASLGLLVATGFMVLLQRAPQSAEPPVDPCGLSYVVCFGESAEVPAQERIVTGYTSRPAETDGSPCISADGSNICERYRLGESLCAANWVPLGTKLFVDGLGECTVADRMAVRNKELVDWYFGYDLNAARQWGVQTRLVKPL